MIKIKLPSIFLIVSMLLLNACGKKEVLENSPENLYASFDRKSMLTNQVDNVILPSWKNLLQQIILMQNSADDFANAPIDINLLALQNEWTETYKILKQCEVYQFGPVANGFYWSKLDFWPLRSEAVNELIAENNTFNSDFLTSKGSTVKGMPVIEFLIFDEVSGNSKILDDFGSSADAIKRRDYLKALCDNLKMVTESIVSEWQNSYRNSYIENDDQGISGSVNITINSTLQTLNYIKDMKIGKPFGKKDGILYPLEVEAFSSQQSIVAIQNNLMGLENLVLGKNSLGSNGLGYDDFLDHLNAKYQDGMLSNKILSQLNDCKNKLEVIDTPLQQAISDDPEKVEAVYLSLKQLLVLIQVDMVNNLGVTLTFTDNDGD